MKQSKLSLLIFSILLSLPFLAKGQCTLSPDFLGPPQTVCASHTLGPVTGLSDYVWNSFPTDTFPTHTVNATGLYWVEGKDSLGNICRDTITVLVVPNPVVDLGPDQFFCGPNEIDLCPVWGPPGGPMFTIHKYYFDSLSMSFVPLPQFPCRLWIDSTTTLRLDIEDQNGCIAGDTIVLFYNQTIRPQLRTYADFGNNQGAVKVNVTGGQAPYEYSWDWGTNWGTQDSLSGFSGGHRGRIYIRDATNCTTIVNFVIPRQVAVYPGDCDHNGRVDMTDLFPLALHHAETGPARPNASLTWGPQVAPLWNQNQINGHDLRHADTDGNGTIAWLDTLAILQNFDSIHAYQPIIPSEEGVPLHIAWQGGIHHPGDSIKAWIMIGKPDTNIFSLLGVAFDIELDAGLVDLSTVKILAYSNWLGDHGLDMIQLKREDRFFGKYELGMVKSDGMPETGFGALAEISFVLGSWPLSRDTSLRISFGEAKAINHLGEEIDLKPQDGELTISSTTSVTQDLSASFMLYPNPSQGSVLLSFPESMKAEFDLFDVLGKSLPLEVTKRSTGALIDLTAYPLGTYLLQVSTPEGRFQKRILLIP